MMIDEELSQLAIQGQSKLAGNLSLLGEFQFIYDNLSTIYFIGHMHFFFSQVRQNAYEN